MELDSKGKPDLRRLLRVKKVSRSLTSSFLHRVAVFRLGQPEKHAWAAQIPITSSEYRSIPCHVHAGKTGSDIDINSVPGGWKTESQKYSWGCEDD